MLRGKAATRSAAWSDYVEPSYIPGPSEAFFFMGADPCWAPHREPVTSSGHPLPMDGPCPACGSDGRWAWLIPLAEPVWLPGKIAEGSPTYCATCARWGRDALVVDALLREWADRGSIDPIPA